MRALAAIALCAALLLSSGNVSAQEGPTEDPRALFLQGQEDYEAGRYEAAAENWDRAYELSGRAALLYNLSQAYSRLGRLEDELRVLREFVDAEGMPPRMVGLAVRRIQALEERVARTGLTISGGPEGAQVSLDGEPIGVLPIAEPILIAAGSHEVRVDLEGYATFHTSAAVVAGQLATVTVSMAAIAAEYQIPVGVYALWGGGGAALVTGAILGGLALGKADGAVDGSSEADTARAMALGADITLAVGVAAVVGGTIWYLLDRRSDDEPDEEAAAVAVRVSPYASHVGAGLHLQGSF